MLSDCSTHHSNQKSAALFGSFASTASMKTAIHSGLDTFIFNLSIHRWPDRESPPDYWWITEEKIFLECEQLKTFFGGASPSRCRMLLPNQLGKWGNLFCSGNVEKIELKHFAAKAHPAPLELQAAALWHSSQRGYRNIFCLGFDHFLSSGNPPVFKNDFLPRFSKLKTWDSNVSDIRDSTSRVRFVSSENLRNPSYDWLQDHCSPQSYDCTLSLASMQEPGIFQKIQSLFRK